MLLILKTVGIALESEDPITLLTLRFVRLSLDILFNINLRSCARITIVLILCLYVQLPLCTRTVYSLTVVYVVTIRCVRPTSLRPRCLTLLCSITLTNVTSSLLSVTQSHQATGELLSRTQQGATVLTRRGGHARQHLHVTGRLRSDINRKLASVVTLSRKNRSYVEGNNCSSSRLTSILTRVASVTGSDLNSAHHVLGIFGRRRSRPSLRRINLRPIGRSSILHLQS